MDFHPLREWIHGNEGDSNFHLHLMEKVPPCQCFIRQKVRHLCPSNVALLWAAQAVCPVGRWRNAGRNQLHPHACPATNRNRKGRSKACPAGNAQGSHVCPTAVVHGPRAGVHPPNTQANWPSLGVGPAVCCRMPDIPPPVTLGVRPCRRPWATSPSRGGQ